MAPSSLNACKISKATEIRQLVVFFHHNKELYKPLCVVCTDSAGMFIQVPGDGST